MCRPCSLGLGWKCLKVITHTWNTMNDGAISMETSRTHVDLYHPLRKGFINAMQLTTEVRKYRGVIKLYE